MLIRNKPLGIWVISALLLVAASIASGMSINSGYEGMVTVVSFALAGVFITGLMIKVRWLYVGLMLFLALVLFLQVVATLLIVTSIVASGEYDWPLIIGRYWGGALFLIALLGAISYLGRMETRSYLFPERYQQKQRPY